MELLIQACVLLQFTESLKFEYVLVDLNSPIRQVGIIVWVDEEEVVLDLLY